MKTFDNVFEVKNFNNENWNVVIFYSEEQGQIGYNNQPDIFIVKLSVTDSHGVTAHVTDQAELDNFLYQYYDGILDAVLLNNRVKRSKV